MLRIYYLMAAKQMSSYQGRLLHIYGNNEQNIEISLTNNSDKRAPSAEQLDTIGHSLSFWTLLSS